MRKKDRVKPNGRIKEGERKKKELRNPKYRGIKAIELFARVDIDVEPWQDPVEKPKRSEANGRKD